MDWQPFINKPEYVSLIKYVNCKINKVLFKTNHGVIKFLLRNKTIVESSQLMLPKLIPKNKFIFWNICKLDPVMLLKMNIF